MVNKSAQSHRIRDFARLAEASMDAPVTIIAVGGDSLDKLAPKSTSTSKEYDHPRLEYDHPSKEYDHLSMEYDHRYDLLSMEYNYPSRLSKQSNQLVSKTDTSEPGRYILAKFESEPTAKLLRELLNLGDVSSVEKLLAQHMEAVATGEFHWLNELVKLGYEPKDIAILLIQEEADTPWITIQDLTDKPWITIQDLTVDSQANLGKSWVHQPDCVHTGGTQVDLAKISIEGHKPTQSIHLEHVKEMVASYCGLAGIIPISGTREQWIDLVEFDDGDPGQATISFRPAADDTLTMSTRFQEDLSATHSALYRLVITISWLHARGFCCISFTIFRKPRTVQTEAIELVQIPFELISELFNNISSLHSNAPIATKWEHGLVRITVAAATAQRVLNLIYGDSHAESSTNKFATFNASKDPASLAHHICAIATQSLCLGLLSYSNAHVSPIQPCFLTRAIKTINLLGTNPGQSLTDVTHHFDSVDLTCFGSMVGHPVMVFSSKSKLWNEPHLTSRYNVLASPEDIIDTWGPGRFVVDPTTTALSAKSSIYALEIGGGILAATEIPGRYHWEKRHLQQSDLTKIFNSTTKILIAGTKVNSPCPLSTSESWLHCTPLTDNLGTKADSWRQNEKQTGAQLGQYAVLQFNSTWLKQDGITLKDRHLRSSPDSIYLPFLESLWGLQVSLCTGVARRVLIREMLADVMVAYVEQRLPIPKLWNILVTQHDIVNRFRSPNLERWFKSLTRELQMVVVEIVRYILETLADTGYNSDKDEFIVAWPYSEDPFRCFKIPCRKNEHLWARALADSEVCATFAYITPDCLEDENGQKCRKSAISQWQNRAVSLDTAVCPHNPSQGPIEYSINWVLKPEVSYWIGKPGSDLIAKVTKSAIQTEMRMTIAHSSIPESVRRRMAVLRQVPYCRIREKQRSREIHAKQVLILTATAGSMQ